jgi:carbon storage regulator
MLVLSRKSDESLIIAGEIVVTILGIEGDRVKLGITAPPEVVILRQEVHDRRARRRPAPPPGQPERA